MDAEELRRAMVDRQIARRGVADQRVLHAMGAVRRERFVPAGDLEQAYSDHALPIACDQTISQPYVVALMAEAVEIGPDDRVLEIGTGSGYGAAVLARLAAQVWTIERHEDLADHARAALEGEGVRNVHVLLADGTRGWPEAAPYDAIVVTARSDRVPDALLEQLGDGGRLVMPVGDEDAQALVRLRRVGAELHREELGAVRFVPLVPDVS
jgi:protein-L-isoaspartate(D-aspartate) O-methyltransferase